MQDGVPSAIQSLLDARIKVWVITGDKQETAVSAAAGNPSCTISVRVHVHLSELALCCLLGWLVAAQQYEALPLLGLHPLLGSILSSSLRLIADQHRHLLQTHPAPRQPAHLQRRQLRRCAPRCAPDRSTTAHLATSGLGTSQNSVTDPFLHGSSSAGPPCTPARPAALRTRIADRPRRLCKRACLQIFFFLFLFPFFSFF